MNLVQNLRHRAELQPGVPAIVDRTVRGDRVVSFVAFNRSVDFLALRPAGRRSQVGAPGSIGAGTKPRNSTSLLWRCSKLAPFQLFAGKALGSSFSHGMGQKRGGRKPVFIPQSRWLTQHFPPAIAF